MGAGWQVLVVTGEWLLELTTSYTAASYQLLATGLPLPGFQDFLFALSRFRNSVRISDSVSRTCMLESTESPWLPMLATSLLSAWLRYQSFDG